VASTRSFVKATKCRLVPIAVSACSTLTEAAAEAALALGLAPGFDDGTALAAPRGSPPRLF
jgi:hypothetical protein